MDFVQTELCEYLQVRHSKLDATTAAPDSPTSSTPSSPSRSGSSQSHTQASLPSKFYKVGSLIASIATYIHARQPEVAACRECS